MIMTYLWRLGARIVCALGESAVVLPPRNLGLVRESMEDFEEAEGGGGLRIYRRGREPTQTQKLLVMRTGKITSAEVEPDFMDAEDV